MARYIDIATVRVADPTGDGYPDWEDAQIGDMIDRWQEFIETHTGQFFEERELTLLLDGQGGRILHLPIPIIELQQLQVNNSGVDELLADVVVYNARGFPRDDRLNPKIVIKIDRTSIFSGVNGERKFWRGYQNQLVKGKFGYTETDGTTPLRIRRALLRLVVMEIERGDDLGAATRPGMIVKETTDGHSISYGGTGGGGDTASLTGDAEVDQTIADYRAPATVGVTRFAYGSA